MIPTAGSRPRRVPGYLGRVLDSDGSPAGTCFQVKPGLLITAWHVLAGIGAVSAGSPVRIDPLAGGSPFAAVVARLNEDHDLAVLTSDGGLPGSAGALTATDRLPLRAEVTVTGYVVIPDSRYVYEFLDAPGEWAGRVSRNSISLGRMKADAVVPGMSGAPVIHESSNLIAGVVSGRYNSIDGWLEGTVWVARTEDLSDLLDGLADLDFHPVAPADESGRDGPWSFRRAKADYLPTIREIQLRTPSLEDREEELRLLAEFSCSHQGYKLISGEHYAGKTALLAEFVAAHLPAHVDVIAYFASRSLSDADSNKFLAEVVPQLAELLGVSAPDAVPRQFRSLWQEAARRARSLNRHLLLVVDGLDEDYAPAGLPRIGALLPVAVAPTTRDGDQDRAGLAAADSEWSRAHVLVSNRRGTPLPRGLPSDHPLRVVSPMTLTPYRHARPNDAQEFDNLLGLGPDARRFLGALAAAGGALSIDDLQEITRLPAERLDEVISQTRRSLLSIGPRSALRYAFRSVSMLDVARGEPDLGLSRYREAIRRWADGWSQCGWQRDQKVGKDVPRYLLDSYPDSLTDDPGRRSALVSDVGWVTAAIDSIAVDLVLAQLRTTVAATREDNGPQAMLAIVRSQAPFLRSQPSLAPGQAARQLCLQAAEFDNESLAALFRDRLAAYPGLVPLWTSRRPHPALVAEINGQAGWVNAVALALDGGVIAGTDDGRIWRWDPSTSVARPVPVGLHNGPVRALAVLGDGRLVSGGHDGEVLLWDLSQPVPDPVKLGQHVGAVRALAVHANGTVISGGDDACIRAWRPDEPRPELVEVGRHAGAIRSLAVDPAGRIISGGDDQRVRIWDLSRREVYLAQTARLGWRVMAVAAASDREVVLAGTDFAIYRWHHMLGDGSGGGSGTSPAGSGVVGLGGHHNVVRAISTTDEGIVISGGDDGRILLWRAGNSRGIDRIVLGHHEGSVRALTALVDDRLATGGKDQQVRLWDLRGLAFALADSKIRLRPANAVSICPGGEVVTGTADKQLLLWKQAQPRGPEKVGDHGSAISAIITLSDGRIVSSGIDGKLCLWDPAAKSCQPISRDQASGVVLAALDDDLVVTGGYDGQVRLWNPAGESASVLVGRHRAPVVALAALGDGRVISGGTAGDIVMWERDRPGDGREFERYETRLNVLAVVSGHLVGGGDDGSICIWDLTGRMVNTVMAHENAWLTSLAALPSGHLISAGTDDQMILWQFADRELRNVSSVACSVRALSARRISNGHESVAVAHVDSGLSFWNVLTQA
jgi:WD40 repeat protein